MSWWKIAFLILDLYVAHKYKKMLFYVISDNKYAESHLKGNFKRYNTTSIPQAGNVKYLEAGRHHVLYLSLILWCLTVALQRKDMQILQHTGTTHNVDKIYFYSKFTYAFKYNLSNALE